MRQAILGRATGTIVVTGEPGMGRTTFLACAMGCADPERDEILLLNSSSAAWRRLALDRTDGLCRLALGCGAREEIAPIWAMLLLLRGRTQECMAFLESLDVAGQMPLWLAAVRALALALGFGRADEASGHVRAGNLVLNSGIAGR